MTKENILLRFFGLCLLIFGIYWFFQGGGTIPYSWNSITFQLPVQVILIAAGFFTLVLPAPFLRILSLILPKEWGEKFENFINRNLNVQDKRKIVINPDDTGEVLAEKLNQAIRASKRRFYLGLAAFVLFLLTALPILVWYLIRSYDIEKTELTRQSELLIEAVQNNQISLSSVDLFRRTLEQTPKIKDLSPDHSSSRRIYDILATLYSSEITRDEGFDDALSSVYKNEIADVFGSGAFDINKIRTPITETDVPESKETLLTLLVIICNHEGDNGRRLPPYFYGRGILNELNKSRQRLPSVAFNADGLNYAGFLKSTKNQLSESNSELVKSVFSGTFPTKLRFANNALSTFEEMNKLDKSTLTRARYLNNSVDVHVALLYILRVDKETFLSFDTSSEEKLYNTLKSLNLTDVLKDMYRRLDDANYSSTNKVIPFTKAQLYSLEGQINKEEKTANGQNLDWCKRQRTEALRFIQIAIGANLKRIEFRRGTRGLFI